MIDLNAYESILFLCILFLEYLFGLLIGYVIWGLKK